MPSHFEINSNSFENLLNDVDPTEPTQTEPVTVSVPDNVSDPEPVDPVPSNNDTISNAPTNDVLFTFLSERGLRDGKVVYENEDGTTDEVDFNDLEFDEKLNILKELTTPNLTKDEIDVINYLRANNQTIQDVIEYYSQKAVNDYINQNGSIEKHYNVDEYTDDALYIADLKEKFSDMTDEEVQADLELAKENEELFKKKVETIRKQYKAQEDAKENEAIKEKEEEFNNFKSSLEEQLNNFNEVSMDYKDSKSHSLEIEDSEKEEIYRYILEQDANGATKFFKDLNDPAKLVELAWFSLYGKEAISDISNYWKSQLKTTRKPESKTQTTVVPQDKQQPKDDFINRHKSVETMYGEDLL